MPVEAGDQVRELKNVIQSYKKDLKEAKLKVQKQEEDRAEMLRNFALAIVDTRADLKIMSTEGPTEVIFEACGDKFEQGKSLVNMVYKATGNTKAKQEPGTKKEEANEEFDASEDLEDTLMNFVEGKRTEKMIKIVGEKEDGEIFLMMWYIKRMDKFFRSFFRIIPSNTIVKTLQEEHEAEIEESHRKLYEMLGLVHDGIIIMNANQKIQFMNAHAKEYVLSRDNALLRNAPVEGRFFHELFIGDDADTLRQRQDYNSDVIRSGKKIDYSMKTKDSDVFYEVHPVKNNKGNAIGIFVICRPKNQIQNRQVSEREVEIGMRIVQEEKSKTPEKIAMKMAIRELTSENRELKEKLKELRINNNSQLKSTRQFQQMVKKLYSFIANVPLPMMVMNLEERKCELVNLAMEDIMDCDRTELLSKTDDEVFPDEISAYLTEKMETALESDDSNEYRHDQVKGQQVVIADAKGNKTHLIRLFTDLNTNRD